MCVNEREAGEKVKVQGADVGKVAFKSLGATIQINIWAQEKRKRECKEGGVGGDEYKE